VVRAGAGVPSVSWVSAASPSNSTVVIEPWKAPQVSSHRPALQVPLRHSRSGESVGKPLGAEAVNARIEYAAELGEQPRDARIGLVFVPDSDAELLPLLVTERI
jgi:hypothetical protein